MTQITDFSTDAAKVRLLIADTDADNLLFSDLMIDAFLSLANDSNIKRAAAIALRTMATNEVMVQKRVRLLSLSTDGPAQSKELRDLATVLEMQADSDEAADGGSFDWAEMALTPHNYDELWARGS
jgi:hypothetical protein